MTQLPTDSVRQVTDPGGRPSLELRGPEGTILVGLLGAHVQSWVVKDEDEQLFMSAEADYSEGVASRGGIPVVFPWFGAHPTRSDLAAHGFARTSDWEVSEVGPGARVTLRLTDSDETRAQWPHSFLAEYTVSAEAGLTVALSITNTGDEPFTFEEALHTYFKVGAAQEATVHGLENVHFTEFAKAPATDSDPAGMICFTAETDRVYQGVPDTIQIRSHARRRLLQLKTAGADSAIVWNPWIEKAAAMSQMGDDEWEEFVCVESANCKGFAVGLQPGQEHTLELALARLLP